MVPHGLAPAGSAVISVWFWKLLVSAQFIQPSEPMRKARLTKRYAPRERRNGYGCTSHELAIGVFMLP